MSNSRKLKRAVQKFGKLTVNKLVLASLRTGIPLPQVNPDCVTALATVGRRSGKPRITPMGYVQVDERTLRVVSEHGVRSDWYRNAQAAGSVELLLDRKFRPATVHLIPDADPQEVLRGIRSRMVAWANRLLWSAPKVIEFRLTD